MRLRLLPLLFLTLMLAPPGIAQADELTPTVNASQLGPAAAPGSAGGSNADVSALQPAGGDPLQSSTEAQNGITSPTNSALQAPASNSDALQVLAGEADGEPKNVATSGNGGPNIPWPWVISSLLVALIMAGAFGLMRRRRAQPSQLTAEPTPTIEQPELELETETESEVEPESEQRPEPESEPEADAEPQTQSDAAMAEPIPETETTQPQPQPVGAVPPTKRSKHRKRRKN